MPEVDDAMFDTVLDFALKNVIAEIVKDMTKMKQVVGISAILINDCMISRFIEPMFNSGFEETSR